MERHILIIDDDPLMGKMLAFLLEGGGYWATTLIDPRQADEFLKKNAVALILLDVMLPYMNGLALCTALRREHPDVPVIFLSARGAVADTVAGFGHGADDYIRKPFEPGEMLARIRAVLRRYRTGHDRPGMVIEVGDTALDLRELRFTGPSRRPALLAPTEMKILECLMRNANAATTREALIERTWGCHCKGIEGRVDVYIRRLRKKIEADPNRPEYIVTVRGFGYQFHATGGAGMLSYSRQAEDARTGSSQLANDATR